MKITFNKSIINWPQAYNKYHKNLHSDFEGYSQFNNEMTLFYKNDKTQAQIDAILAHDLLFVDVDNFTYIKEQVLIPAMEFGRLLMLDFTTDNIMLGITQYNKTNTVRKALAEVESALRTGSLKDAITEMRAIPANQKDTIFITDARILVMINKLETYLGLPLSTSV
jgi:hypothetical protein